MGFFLFCPCLLGRFVQKPGTFFGIYVGIQTILLTHSVLVSLTGQDGRAAGV